MNMLSRWSCALLISVMVHLLILLGWNSSTLQSPSLLQAQNSDITDEKGHWIVIQNITKNTNSSSDTDFVWSSEDHFTPKQSRHRHATPAPSLPHRSSQEIGISGGLKNIFEIPNQFSLAGIDGDDPENIMNSRKYKHYSFFKRIFEKLYPVWTSELSSRSDQWGKYSEGAYLNRIRFRMNATGYITQMNMLLSSRAKAIDEASLYALRRSQPFPNPPQDFAVGKDEYEFVYEFLFELNKSGPLLHLVTLPMYNPTL